MNDNLLPIGTIVLLKNGKKRLMIAGYYPITDINGKQKKFDYSAFLFPEGIVDSNHTFLFNKGDIDKIFFIGFVDEEQKKFMNALMNQTINKSNNI